MGNTCHTTAVIHGPVDAVHAWRCLAGNENTAFAPEQIRPTPAGTAEWSEHVEWALREWGCPAISAAKVAREVATTEEAVLVLQISSPGGSPYPLLAETTAQLPEATVDMVTTELGAGLAFGARLQEGATAAHVDLPATRDNGMVVLTAGGDLIDATTSGDLPFISAAVQADWDPLTWQVWSRLLARTGGDAPPSLMVCATTGVTERDWRRLSDHLTAVPGAIVRNPGQPAGDDSRPRVLFLGMSTSAHVTAVLAGAGVDAWWEEMDNASGNGWEDGLYEVWEGCQNASSSTAQVKDHAPVELLVLALSVAANTAPEVTRPLAHTLMSEGSAAATAALAVLSQPGADEGSLALEDLAVVVRALG